MLQLVLRYEDDERTHPTNNNNDNNGVYSDSASSSQHDSVNAHSAGVHGDDDGVSVMCVRMV